MAVVDIGDGLLWKTNMSPNAPASWVTQQTTPAGKEQVWFYLERLLNADPNIDNNYRSEVQGYTAGVTAGLVFGSHYRVDFDLIVPADWERDNLGEILFQVHNVADVAEQGYPGSSPIFALEMIGNDLRATYRYSTAKTAWPGNFQVTGHKPSLLSIAASQTHKVRIDIQFSRGIEGDPGYFRVTINGVLVAIYNGPIGFDDDAGHYMKFGIYKYPWIPNDSASDTDFRRYGFEDMKIRVAETLMHTRPRHLGRRREGVYDIPN